MTPTVELATTDMDSSSVTFSLSETDPDEVGAVTKIELLDKDGTVINGVPIQLEKVTGGFRGSYRSTESFEYLKCTEIEYTTEENLLHTVSVACVSDRPILARGTVSVDSNENPS